jgi:multicomponent Na+:H+ antiporter subunit E
MIHDTARLATERFAVWQHLIMLVGNTLMAILWMVFNSTFTLRTAAGGFLFVAVVLTIYRRSYLRWLARIFLYVGYVTVQIAASCIEVAVNILTNKRHPQALVAYELRADTDIETLLLASSITLTPGTIAVDSRYRPDGRRLLYVHLLDGRDPELFRLQTRRGFERRIMQLARE